jgi:polar amino acid transport system substrate-binding protein
MGMKSPLLAAPVHLPPDRMGHGNWLLSQARQLAAGALTGLLVCGAPSAPPALAQASDQIEAEVARVGALDRILEAGVVRIAVPSDLPPFGSRSSDGQIQGYDIDVARLLADGLGVRLELVPVTSGDRIAALLTLRADLVVANLGISPERAKLIAFSSPYAPFFIGIYGPVELQVKGAADLKGRTVGVTRDTIEDRALAKLGVEGVEILKFDDNEKTLAAFSAGRVELVATGNVVAAALMNMAPDRKIEAKLVLQDSPASIGVRRDEPGLLRWVNVFVFSKKLDGELDRISRKWLRGPLPALPTL